VGLFPHSRSRFVLPYFDLDTYFSQWKVLCPCLRRLQSSPSFSFHDFPLMKWRSPGGGKPPKALCGRPTSPLCRVESSFFVWSPFFPTSLVLFAPNVEWKQSFLVAGSDHLEPDGNGGGPLSTFHFLARILLLPDFSMDDPFLWRWVFPPAEGLPARPGWIFTHLPLFPR